MDYLQKVILSYPPLKKYIGGNGLERANCFKNLEEIRADYSPLFIKKLGDLMDFPFSKMYDGIHLELSPHLKLLKLCQENNVILVPNHQSHLDYLALNYALHRKYNFQIPIHVAGGINLNIFPIGTIFRRSGCFFIRRSFINDRNYKHTFEAYIYYLLKERVPIEFFFEGGRSRTGKLLPPRFGLFNMILDAHNILAEQGHEWPLAFVPISIMHEFVPEEKSLAKELRGSKKKQESSAQMLKLWRFFSKKFGTIHIKIGHPIMGDENTQHDLRRQTQRLAFKCYRSVGSGMSVTPISLLSLIMLDDPSGALTYKAILAKTKRILDYCQQFGVPVTSRLSGDQVDHTLKRAIELLVKDKKIKLLKKEKLEQEFYVVEDNRRLGLLYFKNSTLHQFLVPFFMNSLLINIINDQVKTLDDLKHLLKAQRDLLKYEFYLPEVKEVIQKSLEIIGHALGRNVKTLKDVLKLTTQEFFKVAKVINLFVRAPSYIYEGYYVGCLALKHLKDDHFNTDQFLKVAKEIHDIERQHGRLIRFNESYSVPLLKNALKYYKNRKLVRKDGDFYLLVTPKATEELIDDLAKYLTEHLTFNLKTLN